MYIGKYVFHFYRKNPCYGGVFIPIDLKIDLSSTTTNIVSPDVLGRKNTLTLPSSSGFSSEEEGPPPNQDNRKYMNQPHLRFEITSDDGFSVKADSIEGTPASYSFCSPFGRQHGTSVPKAQRPAVYIATI